MRTCVCAISQCEYQRERAPPSASGRVPIHETTFSAQSASAKLFPAFGVALCARVAGLQHSPLLLPSTSRTAARVQGLGRSSAGKRLNDGVVGGKCRRGADGGR
eukprot:1432071-Rhodomonas_salina.1